MYAPKLFENHHVTRTSESNEYDVPIRTLYFTPVKTNLPKNISDYFEQFGVVESLCVHVQRYFEYGFVQFKSSKIADGVLSKATHRVENIAIKVKKADLWHQPDFNAKPNDPVPVEDSPDHILNVLNDDCLRAVFRFFNKIELCNVAEVCVRFNASAKEVFHSKYKHLKLNFIWPTMNQYETERLFRHFGSLIQSLTYTGRVFSKDFQLLQTLANFETPQLKELQLANSGIPGMLFTKLRPMFGRLEKIVLNHAFGDSMKELLGACERMKVLQLMGDVDEGKCIMQTFPMLEEVHLIDSFGLTDFALAVFLALNPAITKLEFRNYTSGCSTEVLRLIGENLFNLTELNFDGRFLINESQFQQNVIFLGQIKTLNILKMNCCNEPIAPLMNVLATNQIPIEHLLLYKGSINNEAVESIEKMKRIKVLDLTDIDDLKDEHLVELANGLPQLRELHLSTICSDLSTIAIKKLVSHAKRLTLLKLFAVHTIEVDVDDFKAMLKSVQNRPENTRLVLEVRGCGNWIDVPDAVLQENRDWIHIDEPESLPDMMMSKMMVRAVPIRKGQIAH